MWPTFLSIPAILLLVTPLPQPSSTYWPIHNPRTSSKSRVQPSVFSRQNWDFRQKRVARVSQKVTVELGPEKTRLPDFLDQGSSWGPNWVNPILQTKDQPTVKTFYLITMKSIGLGPGSHLSSFATSLHRVTWDGDSLGYFSSCNCLWLSLGFKNLTWFLKEFSEGWSSKLTGTSEQWFAFKHLILGNPTQG